MKKGTKQTRKGGGLISDKLKLVPDDEKYKGELDFAGYGQILKSIQSGQFKDRYGLLSAKARIELYVAQVRSYLRSLGLPDTAFPQGLNGDKKPLTSVLKDMGYDSNKLEILGADLLVQAAWFDSALQDKDIENVLLYAMNIERCFIIARSYGLSSTSGGASSRPQGWQHTIVSYLRFDREFGSDFASAWTWAMDNFENCEWPQGWDIEVTDEAITNHSGDQKNRTIKKDNFRKKAYSPKKD